MDHVNLTKLLDALERQIAVFDHGDQPDYDIVGGIVDYCLTYPDLHHHPTEDLVLNKLRDRSPESAAEVGPLETDHEQLGQLTRRFAAAVQNILQGAEVSRDAIDDLARTFLNAYRGHMQKEDEVFFVAAEKMLSEQDWNDLDQEVTALRDPLFGDQAEARFARLLDDILTWDRTSSEP
jgi:hemerythrin-like domain-containing protein